MGLPPFSWMKGDVFYVPSTAVTDEDEISLLMFADEIDPTYD